jgi:hypothetical protein
VGTRRRRSLVPRGTDAGHGESRHAGDLERPDPTGSSAWGRPECAVALAAALAPRALRSIDRVLREVEAALGPLAPLADGSGL